MKICKIIISETQKNEGKNWKKPEILIQQKPEKISFAKQWNLKKSLSILKICPNCFVNKILLFCKCFFPNFHRSGLLSVLILKITYVFSSLEQNKVAGAQTSPHPVWNRNVHMCLKVFVKE